MGCSFSGLNAFYDAANGSGDVWINENRFRILRQLGEGGFAFVYLVKEVAAVAAASPGSLAAKKSIDPSHISDDGTYALKKVLIQSQEQLELVREEIRVSLLFNHPNLLPLLDHAIISVKIHSPALVISTRFGSKYSEPNLYSSILGSRQNRTKLIGCKDMKERSDPFISLKTVNS